MDTGTSPQLTRPLPSIQLRFGSHWSPRYGAPGGRAEEFLLQEASA
jgi:hypothetical protein